MVCVRDSNDEEEVRVSTRQDLLKADRNGEGYEAAMLGTRLMLGVAWLTLSNS